MRSRPDAAKGRCSRANSRDTEGPEGACIRLVVEPARCLARRADEVVDAKAQRGDVPPDRGVGKGVSVALRERPLGEREEPLVQRHIDRNERATRGRVVRARAPRDAKHEVEGALGDGRSHVGSEERLAREVEARRRADEPREGLSVHRRRRDPPRPAMPTTQRSWRTGRLARSSGATVAYGAIVSGVARGPRVTGRS